MPTRDPLTGRFVAVQPAVRTQDSPQPLAPIRTVPVFSPEALVDFDREIDRQTAQRVLAERANREHALQEEAARYSRQMDGQAQQYGLWPPIVEDKFYRARGDQIAPQPFLVIPRGRQFFADHPGFPRVPLPSKAPETSARLVVGNAPEHRKIGDLIVLSAKAGDQVLEIICEVVEVRRKPVAGSEHEVKKPKAGRKIVAMEPIKEPEK